MAWMYIKLSKGTLKIKPRHHMRSMEINRQLPVLDLGLVVISWWSRKNLFLDEERHRVPIGKDAGP